MQMNEITPWIDGGLTYGVSKAWADGLRLFRSNCPERDPSHPNHVPHILAGRPEMVGCFLHRYFMMLLTCYRKPFFHV